MKWRVKPEIDAQMQLAVDRFHLQEIFDNFESAYIELSRSISSHVAEVTAGDKLATTVNGFSLTLEEMQNEFILHIIYGVCVD